LVWKVLVLPVITRRNKGASIFDGGVVFCSYCNKKGDIVLRVTTKYLSILARCQHENCYIHLRDKNKVHQDFYKFFFLSCLVTLVDEL
jgi:hypothetical protein